MGACDLTLATAVAGLAAAHALMFLDGLLPSSAGARWEAAVPGLHWRTRPVRPHAECPCGASLRDPQKAEGEHTPGEEPSHETMAVHGPSDEWRRKADAKRPAGTWRAHV
ncbi:hypothetical protein SHKM778_15200 [Streptomyces sp. KM77-8]|uniref:Uncharacterized protein n=1 Tax=Streptomyces haneummycinicus TaxID=3074435 RepID=A0AAT9HD51_9ACTN